MALPGVNIQPAPQAGGSFWGGTPAQVSQLGKFDQGTQNAIAQLLQMGMQGAQQNMSFAPIEEQARRQFHTRTMPSLAERFGNLGGERSGGYQNMLANAGADFESQLAALKSQHNTQMMPYLNQMMQMGLTPQYDTSYIRRQPGALENILGPLMQILGQLGGMYGMSKFDNWLKAVPEKAPGTVNPTQTGTTDTASDMSGGTTPTPSNGIDNLRQLTGSTGPYGVHSSSGFGDTIGKGLQYGGPIAGQAASMFFPGGPLWSLGGNALGAAGSAMRS